MSDKTVFDPDRISEKFRLLRERIICPGCTTPGRITFSRDGNGRLRFGCANKLKSCRKSFSMKTMAEMIEQLSPGTLTSLILVDNSGSTVLANKSVSSMVTKPGTISNTATGNITSSPSKNTPSVPTNATSNKLVEDFGALRNKRLRSHTPPDSPALTRARIINSDINVDNNGNDAEEVMPTINNQQIIIDHQATEISLLREELKLLSSQVTTLITLFQQQNSSTPTPTTLNNPTVSKPAPLTSNISSIITAATTTSSNQHQSFKPKKTYAQIAASRGIAEEDQPAAIKAIEELCKRPRIRQTYKNLDKVYVQGIPRQPIKKLKQLFQSLRIRTSAIPSISFLGLQTAEFLVSSDYSSNFKKIITSLSPVEGRFKILDNYDASKAADPAASVEVKERLQATFVRRLHGLIEHNSNKTVKEYYNSWLAKLSLPQPVSAQPETEQEIEVQISGNSIHNQHAVKESAKVISRNNSETDLNSDTSSESEPESDDQMEPRSQDLSRVETPELPNQTATTSYI